MFIYCNIRKIKTLGFLVNIKNISLFILSLIILQLAIYTIQDKPVIEKIEMKEFNDILPKLTPSEIKFENFFFLLDKELVLLKNSLYFKQFVKEDLYGVEIEDFFLHILKTVPELYQLRYIDNKGNEIIRVQRNQYSLSLVPKNKLQNKKDRYYFKEIMESKDNKIWLSKVDYNMENGVIDKPKLKTLRIGIPVLVNKLKKGILIANIKMEQFQIDDGPFLESFRTNTLKKIYISF